MPSSPRERAQQIARLRQQQEALLKDLLPVLDALDRAEAHWHQAQTARQAPAVADPGGPNRWQRLLLRLAGSAATATPDITGEVVKSASEGIRLIRRTLLEALQRHGVEPIDSLGHRFDPERMLALGQRPGDGDTPADAVVEEVVRGYVWHQTLLREAQVLVAGP